MDFYEAVQNRYSVRSYATDDVDDETLQRILTAAQLAPTARNRQEYRLVVVRDAAVRKRLAEAAEQPFVGQAPVVIAAIGLTPQDTMSCGVPTDPVDCAIVLEHVALAATAEGLGVCWIGHFEQDAARKALNVPETATVIQLMPLGRPADAMKGKSRKPLRQLVCRDQFA